jgi:rhodanese-related sulfurtransferase
VFWLDGYPTIIHHPRPRSRSRARRLGVARQAVHRYQLGIAIWRALGGPTAIEIGGIMRIIRDDRSAVFFDARQAVQFAQSTMPGAHNLRADDLASRPPDELPLPKDDFNRRVVLFGSDAAQAWELAELLSKRPWHNVAYFPGRFDALAPLTKQESGATSEVSDRFPHTEASRNSLESSKHFRR